MFTPVFWWSIVGIGLMLCEFIAPGLILFFFGLGALVTALVAWLLPLGLAEQLIVFTVASLLSLFVLRRFLKPIFMGSSEAGEEMTEGMVGQEATVSEPIEPSQSGKVELNGVAWKAESDESLEVGAAVVVVEQKSLTVVVKAK